VLALIAADYRAFSRLRGDARQRRWLLALPRLLLNPSLHAVVLVRLASGGPRWLHWLWRNVLIAKHSMDIGHDIAIGPGLILPHPFGIAIGKGTLIGRDVLIAHNVSIGPNVHSLRLPRIGDRAHLSLGATILGDIELGNGCLIGANAFVDFDVPPGGVVGGPRGKLLGTDADERLTAAGRARHA
jgi:serine acetyltransferase